jgi:hypothetical protein
MLRKKNSKITIILFIELLHFNNFILFKFPFNPSNSSFKYISLSRNSNKLDGDLHSILGSLGQLLSQNQLLQIFCCKQHFLRLRKILVKEKILSISICDPTILKILS